MTLYPWHLTTYTPRPPRPTRTPSITPKPNLSNLEGTFTYVDGIEDKIAFIHNTFGTPTQILYTNGPRGPFADYGDFTNDVRFSLLLVYADPALVFAISSNRGPFTSIGPGRGTLQICLSSFLDGGYSAHVQIIHGSRVRQQEILYQDLSTVTGRSPEELISTLETTDRCLPVPVRLPAPAMKQTPGLRISDFTRQSPDCRLPCWNGLTPGNSPEADVERFFQRLGVPRQDIRVDPSRSEYWAYIANYPFEFPATPPSVVVKISDGVVHAISVDGYDYYDFMTFGHLLSNLGTPEHIGLSDWGGQGMLNYDLILHYTSLRTAVEVSGETPRYEPELCNSHESQFSVSVILYDDPSDPYAIDFYETYNGIPDLPAALDKSAHAILAELSAPAGCIALPADSIEP